MEIRDSRDADALIVTLVGRVDAANATALASHLLDRVAGGERRLVVDFAEVDYISSAGLRAMLSLVKRIREVRGGLVLCGMGEPVRQVFDLAGLLPLFTVRPSRAAALASLAT